MRQLKFILLLGILALSCLCHADDSHLFRDIPTAYKGRFRPADAVGRLWFYDLYHKQAIKRSDREAFHSQDGSALDLLWQMHFRGHAPWDEAPFFWLHHSELKLLLGFPPRTDRFSYNELHHAMYSDQEAILRVMKRLIPFYAMKKYHDPANRARSEKLELKVLSPGLWVSFQGDDLALTALPEHPPWKFLKKNSLIATNVRRDMSYLKDQAIAQEFADLIQSINSYSMMMGPLPSSNAAVKDDFELLRGDTPKRIALELEARSPLRRRLSEAGTTFMVLPGRYENGEWFSLNALSLKVYNPDTNDLSLVGNFTHYPDPLFFEIQGTYQALIEASRSKDPELAGRLQDKLAQLLHRGYRALAGKQVVEASGKALTYPTVSQIHVEELYYQYPWIELTAVLYGVAICLFILALPMRAQAFNTFALLMLIGAFALHTVILGMRCYILERPPVSNMFETVVYVPWIAVLASFFLRSGTKSHLALIASSSVALALLLVIKLANVNSGMENVQAVLDSQYWLIVHVLMVVGSYGLFALAGILGHIYLTGYAILQEETPFLHQVVRLTSRSMYFGVALLIPGTILGGVWAAESWGRFWDWDPKESWAFISSCVYLIWIHAYTFRHIGNIGLAIGSVVGLLTISFTWYGVNYILGTGLHSYGFGSGGQSYYYFYLLAEMLFLLFFSFYLKKNLKKKNEIG